MANHEEDVRRFTKIGELRYRLCNDTEGSCDDGNGRFLPDIVEEQFHGNPWETKQEIQYLEESCAWEEAPEKTVAEILGGRLSLVNMSESSDAEVKNSLQKILLLLKKHGVEIECVKGRRCDELSGAPVLFLQTKELSTCKHGESMFSQTKTQVVSPETQVAVKLTPSTFKVLSPEEIRRMYSQIINDILPARMKDMNGLDNPVQTWLVDLGL